MGPAWDPRDPRGPAGPAGPAQDPRGPASHDGLWSGPDNKFPSDSRPSLSLLLGRAWTRVDPRHTTGPHRTLSGTRAASNGIGTAAPAQGPRGPALLMASLPCKQYILLLNPQRTCAGPAWTHAIQRAASHTTQ